MIKMKVLSRSRLSARTRARRLFYRRPDEDHFPVPWWLFLLATLLASLCAP